MNSYRLIKSAWTLTIVAVLVLVAWALTGCAPVQCARPVIEYQPPVLPTVPAGELHCLSDSAYQRLAERDLILRQKIDECIVILDEVREP
jgi:hypothetical protein